MMGGASSSLMAMPGLYSKNGVPFSKTGCCWASAIASTVAMTPSGMGSSSHCCLDSLLPVVKDLKIAPFGHYLWESAQ
jgi:hypothetical protein